MGYALKEELRPDSELNRTQLAIKHADPDKGDCYLEPVANMKYKLHFKDTILDAAIENSDIVRPEIYAKEDTGSYIENNINALGYDCFNPHFPTGIPPELRQLGLGAKCYYMLLAKLRDDYSYHGKPVLLSGRNPFHKASESALRLYISSGRYDKVATDYATDDDGNIFTAMTLAEDGDMLDQIMVYYNIDTTEEASLNIAGYIERYPSLLSIPKDIHRSQFSEALPYQTLILRNEGGTWDIAKDMPSDMDGNRFAKDYTHRIAERLEDMGMLTTEDGRDIDAESLDYGTQFREYNAMRIPEGMEYPQVVDYLRQIADKGYTAFQSEGKKGADGRYSELRLLLRPKGSLMHGIFEDYYRRGS